MAVQLFFKTPEGISKYTYDASVWLEAGASIASVTWVIEGDDSVLAIQAQSKTATLANIWLKAGTLNKTYNIVGLIITDEAEPQKVSRTFLVSVVDDIFIQAST